MPQTIKISPHGTFFIKISRSLPNLRKIAIIAAMVITKRISSTLVRKLNTTVPLKIMLISGKRTRQTITPIISPSAIFCFLLNGSGFTVTTLLTLNPFVMK